MELLISILSHPLISTFINIFWAALIIGISFIFALGIKKNKFSELIKKHKEFKDSVDSLTKLLNSLENKLIGIENKISNLEKYESSVECLEHDCSKVDTRIQLISSECILRRQFCENKLFQLSKELETHRVELKEIGTELYNINEKLNTAQYDIVNNIKESMKNAFKEVIENEKTRKKG